MTQACSSSWRDCEWQEQQFGKIAHTVMQCWPTKMTTTAWLTYVHEEPPMPSMERLFRDLGCCNCPIDSALALQLLYLPCLIDLNIDVTCSISSGLRHIVPAMLQRMVRCQGFVQWSNRLDIVVPEDSWARFRTFKSLTSLVKRYSSRCANFHSSVSP